jgi:ParB family transcriptional regulator, chromosome partitioning protein
MKTNAREIQITRISPNLRAIYTSECIDDTVQSIKSHGQLEPILIWFAYESFRILDGEKRWRACRKLGMRTIKAIISEVA